MDSSRAVNTDPRRSLPKVDRLAQRVAEQGPELPVWAITEAARVIVARARESLSLGEPRTSGNANAFSLPTREAEWVALVAAEARSLAAPHPQRVINATGVVLHTNLGRAPMAAGAAAAAAEIAAGFSDLEFDLETGRRGNRLSALESKLRLLSSAEAAYACNNCAAAVLLILNTLALGREVIVSRGELVEIGGSFRVPEIMKRAGVRLVEVGSTNRTHPRDYEQAIGPDTAMLLKVHRSNFEIRGFTREVSLAELCRIGRTHDVPVVEDLGSGTMLDLTDHGLPDDAFAPGRLRYGPDLVCFSGDKLMGGPQAGLILGSERWISQLRSNPLARALRLDKMTLAALDWTLRAMLDGRAQSELPILRQLLMPIATCEERARAFAKRLGERGIEVSVIRDRVPVGGGSLPGFELDGWVIPITGSQGASKLADRLRARTLPVLARVHDDRLLVDLRTVHDDELTVLEEALYAAAR